MRPIEGTFSIELDKAQGEQMFKNKRGPLFYIVIVYVVVFVIAQIAFQVLAGSALEVAKNVGQAAVSAGGNPTGQADAMQFLQTAAQFGELPLRCIIAPFVATIFAFVLPTAFGIIGFTLMFFASSFMPSTRRN